MSEDQFDSWKTTSGFLDDVDVAITDAVFSYDADYNNGQTCLLILTLENLTDGGDAVTQMLPCGKGWEPVDDGKQVEHESRKPRRFHSNSAYGEWLNHALAVAENEMRGRGASTEAATWIGTSWHVERQHREFKGRDGTKMEAERLVPVAYLGEGAGVEEKQIDIEEELLNKLAELAGAAASHDAFMESAFGLDEVAGNMQVQDLVADSSKNGLYERLKGQ